MAGVDIRERLRSRLVTISRLARWPRRLLALGLLGGAALLAARPHAPDPPARPVPTLTVLVATRDLAAGRLLSAAAVRPERCPGPRHRAASCARATGSPADGWPHPCDKVSR